MNLICIEKGPEITLFFYFDDISTKVSSLTSDRMNETIDENESIFISI